MTSPQLRSAMRAWSSSAVARLLGLSLSLALAASLAGCGPSGIRRVDQVDPDRRGDAGGGGRGGAGGQQAGGTGGLGATAGTAGGAAAGNGDDAAAEQSGGATDPGAIVPQDAAADLTPPPDLAPPDAPLIALGQACRTGDQCASGQCADGVCCASACAMPCFACDLPGKAGQCEAAPAGQDPDNECQAEAVATCGRDGTCDGQGGCRRYPAGTECTPGNCLGATEQGARACDGNGVCQAGTTRSCAPNLCMGATCGTRCDDASQCQNGFFCAAGACQLKRKSGEACVAALQCASGACVDGVCCNTLCGDPCFACNLPAAAGVCTPVPAGADPAGDCPADPPATCQRDGTCNGRGGCRLYPAATECAGAACTGGAESPRRACNGLGVCAPPSPRPCAPFTCGASACKTSCAGPEYCQQPGRACRMGRCLPEALVLHWRFDEEGGVVAEDASGNGHRGVFTGATGTPTALADHPPQSRFSNPRSRLFAGDSRQGVLLAPMPEALKPTRELTLSAWYRATRLDTGGGDARGAEVVSGGNNYLLRVRATDIEVSKRQAGKWERCFGVVSGHLDGAWHHIATTIDASTVRVYFDGVEKCALASTAAMAYDRGQEFWVGRHGQDGDNFDFDGQIDDVRVYNRALTGPEIADLAAGAD